MYETNNRKRESKEIRRVRRLEATEATEVLRAEHTEFKNLFLSGFLRRNEASISLTGGLGLIMGCPKLQDLTAVRLEARRHVLALHQSRTSTARLNTAHLTW